jgi:hypothetical protein
VAPSLDRRFFALLLTHLFETDSSSVPQDSLLLQLYIHTPNCDGLSLIHRCLHITSSTESPQLARQCRFVCVALQSFLSTISPHACPSVLQASPRALTETHHHAESASHIMVGSRSNGTCLREDVWDSGRLAGLRDRRLSFRCPVISANETTSRVESSRAPKRSCCCAPRLLQITPT